MADMGQEGIGMNGNMKKQRKIFCVRIPQLSPRRCCIKFPGRNSNRADCFSIDRVFRNETLDATHLAEFFQVEGLIADYNLSLADLIGVIKEFFARIGITGIQFKPTYNPYTEPSMEIHGYSPAIGKVMELGNSGVFRPEMLRPMGLPEGVSVIAWGMGLERQTLLKYGMDNIRDLSGHKLKLGKTASNPVARFDTD